MHRDTSVQRVACGAPLQNGSSALHPYHRHGAGKVNLADTVATGVGGEELFGDASLEFLLGKVAIVHFPVLWAWVKVGKIVRALGKAFLFMFPLISLPSPRAASGASVG